MPSWIKFRGRSLTLEVTLSALFTQNFCSIELARMKERERERERDDTHREETAKLSARVSLTFYWPNGTQSSCYDGNLHNWKSTEQVDTHTHTLTRISICSGSFFFSFCSFAFSLSLSLSLGHSMSTCFVLLIVTFRSFRVTLLVIALLFSPSQLSPLLSYCEFYCDQEWFFNGSFDVTCLHQRRLEYNCLKNIMHLFPFDFCTPFQCCKVHAQARAIKVWCGRS